MKSTKIDPRIQRTLNEIQRQYPVVRAIVDEICALGGRVFLVGGAVRDILLGLPIKDIDIEVHGIPLQDLELLLKRFGDVSLVGKSFGVLRYPGLAIDFSLPRTDRSGRKPEVALDPFMKVEDAFARRDLTINAMGIDLKTGVLVDPFQGVEDLEHKILRAPNAKFFQEDPLRLFRVMQFISRFQMTPDATLNEICKKMDIHGVSRERIEQEFEKMLLKSARPSLGIRWLKEIGRLRDILPELAATIGVMQDKDWHPEGDVFEHTMQTVDAAAQLPIDNDHLRRILLYAALCHDLGKVSTTEHEDDGNITSIGHDREGVTLTKKMLRRITENKELIDAVARLVKYHMAPSQFIDNNAQASAYKRLANKLVPYSSLALLADLALADRRGRNPKGHEPLKENFADITEFRKRAQQAQVLEQHEKQILFGRDIADIIEPGPKMGELLKRAYEIQLEEGITDKALLKERILQELEMGNKQKGK
jgi:tRNA nucleotidyltransferase (CCA-adding enzyme)